MNYFLEWHNGNKTQLGDLENPAVATQIGDGGAGRILRHAGINGYAIKLYKTEEIAKKNEAKVLALCGDIPSMATSNNHIAQMAWPCGVIRDNRKTFRGFIMPMVDGYSLEMLLQPALRRRNNAPEDMLFRLIIARNLAENMALLNSHGFYAIDLKPANIRVYKETHNTSAGMTVLLDIDGFAFSDHYGNYHAPDMATPEYLFPGVGSINAKSLSKNASNQDQWALSIIIFKLLNDNIHPFQGIDHKAYRSIHPSAVIERMKYLPTLYCYGQHSHSHIEPLGGSLHRYFDLRLHQLFDEAFCNPYQPPAASCWLSILDELLDDSYSCSLNPSHRLLGEICGLCALEGQVSKRPKSTDNKPAINAAKTARSKSSTNNISKGNFGPRQSQEHPKIGRNKENSKKVSNKSTSGSCFGPTGATKNKVAKQIHSHGNLGNVNSTASRTQTVVGGNKKVHSKLHLMGVLIKKFNKDIYLYSCSLSHRLGLIALVNSFNYRPTWPWIISAAIAVSISFNIFGLGFQEKLVELNGYLPQISYVVLFTLILLFAFYWLPKRLMQERQFLSTWRKSRFFSKLALLVGWMILHNSFFPINHYIDYNTYSNNATFGAQAYARNKHQLDQASTISAIQKYLINHNYNPGPIDGLMGSKTRAALKLFSKDTQLSLPKQPSEILKSLHNYHG